MTLFYTLSYVYTCGVVLTIRTVTYAAFQKKQNPVFCSVALYQQNMYMQLFSYYAFSIRHCHIQSIDHRYSLWRLHIMQKQLPT